MIILKSKFEKYYPTKLMRNYNKIQKKKKMDLVIIRKKYHTRVGSSQ